VSTSLGDLQARLPDLMLRDEQRLQRRIDAAQSARDRGARSDTLDKIAAEIDNAQRRVARRRASVPRVSYPAALPISQRRDEILAAVRDHQVVIVAGETGSGKTTQLPKICLELGRGVRGLIGHTQPRRLAARTVAERVAEELGTPLGAAVGYSVRFTDHVSADTMIRLMTDGILLAEIQRNRHLRQYDTLIIDEAHERSLNIDFILGYLKQLMPERPDLKVVITSATIDPERFSRHFDDAPVVEVSGRTYPVQVRYRPIVDPDDPEADRDRDQTQAIRDAVGELRAEAPGDILVFLSGEREIRDAADALRRLHLPNTEVLPLYARLSAADQHRVFQPHPGRRIVLATNVAETSLTVPGIRYVIDAGTARISRYSHRLKVQRLPIEAVSQASARQRAGRCGRTSDGICVRLYTEDDFLARPEFTEPEVLRTNLASVVLQMTALGLGDVAAFPFIDPPDRRNISDGVSLLHELGALDSTEPDERRRLTPLGRRLAQLPIDPRLGRMVLAAADNGCAHEVLVIAAALSIQDPRERPTEAQQAADEKHRRFADPTSDFLAYLNLWQHLTEQQKALSSSQFRRMCRAEFLHYLRVREWQDLYGQLRQVAKSLGIRTNPTGTPAEPQLIHTSLLAGLLSHIGMRDVEKQEYIGARGARFAVFPGSVLFAKPPRWVMAAELVDTSRLWGRITARIEPDWVEPLAGHLVHRTYSEPHWDSRRGAVTAYERVTLYGVPIVTRRAINYGLLEPELSREMFIRHALVEGDWETHHEFFHRNRSLLAEVEEMENRARRRDILVDDQTLFDFYDQRVGAGVVSTRHFDSWWKKVRRTQPDLLTFPEALLLNERAAGVSEQDYPDAWREHGQQLPLTYQFEPGSDTDGVTVHIPLPVLNQVPRDAFDWQIPGLRAELVTALIRSLPKPLRRNFVPAPDYAKAVLKRVTPGEESLLDAVERELLRMTGVRVPREAWQLNRLPDHLRMTFRVVDDGNRILAEGKDLAALQERLAPSLRAAISAAVAGTGAGIERHGLRAWTIGALPQVIERPIGDHVVAAYPALVDEQDSVAVRVFESADEQRHAMWPGTRRLLLLNLPSPVKWVSGRLSNPAKLALMRNPHGSVPALLEDCVRCTADALLAEHGGPAWDEAGFGRLLDAVGAGLNDGVLDVVTLVERILRAAREVETQVGRIAGASLQPALTDISRQLSTLVYPGFVTETGRRQLPELPRYLRATSHRLEKLPQDVLRDQVRMAQIHQLEQEYQQLLDALPPAGRDAAEVRRIRWMIEELRVSLFAQTLGTAYPVSEKRIIWAIYQVSL
jgi:ATP-dependent helicase HrpA